MSGGTTILCVDGDQDGRGRLQTLLSEAGYAVAEASDAAEATEALAAESVDAVVAAHDLPDGNGLELLSRVADRFDVAVVLCPAAGSERLAGRALQAGLDGYLPRADAETTLVERVEAALSDVCASDGSDDHVDADAAVPEGGVLDPETASQRDRFSFLVEQSPLAIVEWTPECTVAGWNRAAEALFGYSAAEAMGRHAHDLLGPESEHDAVDAVRKELLGGADEMTHVVNENVTADGDRITCEWHNTALTDEDGDVVGTLSFVRDVTEQTERVEALESLQEMARELIGANSEQEVAEIVIDAADDVLTHSLVALRLHDAGDDTLTPIASHVDSGDELDSLGRDDGPLWRAFDDGRQVVYTDTDEFGSVDSESLLVQPLGEFGVLSFGATDSETFDETDRHLASVVGAAAEAALERAERKRELERRETLLDAVGDGLYALDTEGRYTEINDAVASMTGYSREELLGEHASSLMTEDDVERGRERIERLLVEDGPDVDTYEVTIFDRNGDGIPCEVNMSLLPGEEFTGSVGTVRDVSQRKRMERKLRERKRKIESIHRVATQLKSCRDIGTIFDLAVDAARDVLEFDVCAIRTTDGTTTCRVVDERSPVTDDAVDDGLIDQPAYDRACQESETVVVGDLPTSRSPVGPIRSLLSTPVGDAGVFQAVSADADAFDHEDAELAELLFSHVANTVERVQFETQLREERDRFAALFENVPDPVVSTQLEGGQPIIIDVNPAFERVFGYDAEKLRGEQLDEYIVPPDERDHSEELTDRGARGELVETEVQRQTATGLRDFMLTVVPVEVGTDNSTTYGVYTDITERKRQQKRVEVLNRVLRHDLRNGMNIVKGCAEMLGARVEEDSEYATTIQERADELIALAEKTRAVERTLARDDADPGSVDVVNAIRELTDRVEDEFEDVDFRTSTPDSAYALSDSMLGTAIYHVVENAIVHNDADVPSVDVDVSLDERSQCVEISVADNGPGIPDEERELLAEDREITQLRHASGLGLWLVNWVVTQSGGQLSFEESDDGGTRVVLEVPRARVEQQPA
jgi:PAS domain S-box-containing protein